jgi:hypothetical protein
MSMVWLAKSTSDPPLAVLYAFYRQRVSIVLQMTVFQGSLCFQFSFLYPSLICFLQLVEVLKHNLFLCPFLHLLGLCTFGLDLGPLSLSFLGPFPIAGCFVVMEFTMISSISR